MSSVSKKQVGQGQQCSSGVDPLLDYDTVFCNSRQCLKTGQTGFFLTEKRFNRHPLNSCSQIGRKSTSVCSLLRKTDVEAASHKYSLLFQN